MVRGPIIAVAVATFALGACGPEVAAPPIVLALPPSPPPVPPEPATKTAAAATTDPVPKAGGPLDLASAPIVRLKDSPAQAGSPRPIGAKPAKTRAIREVSRVSDPSAVARQQGPHRYDPKQPYEFLMLTPPHALPDGARRDIPLVYDGLDLLVISESGGKLLLVYGPRYIAVVDGTKVEQILDMDPPGLPLSPEDRASSDVHQAVLRNGVVFVCRGYNGWFPSRKGYVTAVDVATGELRWRSRPKTCGGVLAIIDDYVITGYGAIDTPYALTRTLTRTPCAGAPHPRRRCAPVHVRADLCHAGSVV